MWCTKKMSIIISIAFLIVILCFIGVQRIYLKSVDTKYATNYSKAIGGYNIDEVDKYLDKDTQIIYNGMTKPYSELRDNLKKAFDDKEFNMPQQSSYGHGNDKFIDSVQEVWVITFVEYKEKLNEDVLLEIERKGLFSCRIKSIRSEGRFFGYLFFGNED